jgi:hypothetical protein
MRVYTADHMDSVECVHAFKELEPISQFNVTAKLGEFLESVQILK